MTNQPNVNVYGGGWGGDDWGYGVATGAMMGLATGAVIASANSQPSTVVVEQQPATVIQQQAPAAQPTPAAPAIGSYVTTLPTGSQARNINGVMAYENSGSWYKPFFGASGVYYQVMPPPPADGKVANAPNS